MGQKKSKLSVVGELNDSESEVNAHLTEEDVGKLSESVPSSIDISISTTKPTHVIDLRQLGKILSKPEPLL
jgi:hypothetical protein